jgi:hypothetical protein
MKKVTMEDFIVMLQEEHRTRYNQQVEIQYVTFMRDLREDTRETTEMLVAVAKRLKVPVNKGRLQEEFLKKGTFYNVQDMYEEFVRLSILDGAHNYRLKWWVIGTGVMALSIYCMFQALPVHASLVAIAGGGIFERLRGLPRVY